MKITKEKTLIILDWDDTLFPTTWAMKNGIDLKSDYRKYTVYFSDLDSMLYKLFLKLQKCGKVVIVTNALPEWVKLSSSVLKKSEPLIRNIKVISARKIYQNIVGNSMEWKKIAFHDELKNVTKTKDVNNIISIGDAEYEYQALINLHKKIKGIAVLKSIKLMRNPTYESLIDQLNVLHSVVPEVCAKRGHGDLNFKSDKK